MGGGSRPVVLLGRIGYVAKGFAYVIAGVIVGWATFAHDAARAAGLDAALRTVKQQPYGPILLTVLAAGFVCSACTASAGHGAPVDTEPCQVALDITANGVELIELGTGRDRG